MLAFRLPLSTGWGLFLSLVTFWFLWMTINMPLDVGERVVANPIQFTRLLADSKPLVDVPREKPEFVPPQTMGPAGPIKVPKTPPVRGKPEGRPHIELGIPPGPVTTTGGSDQDAIPWVRIQPDYPLAAERRGIEGRVLVQFSVTAGGQVTDVVVIDANPPGVFDKETIEAVQRWRYRPMVENGVPVKRVGMQAVISFELQ